MRKEKHTKNGFGNSVPKIIAHHLFTPFNAFNFAIAIAIAAVGAYKNLLYLAIIVCNILIGVIQDIRAKHIVERLALITAPSVLVIRDGSESRISPDELKCGEIFRLSRGDQICADATLLTGFVTVSEALLTGESTPIQKTKSDTLLSGSFVVSGSCVARAYKVGSESYAGTVADAARKPKKTASEILSSLNKLVRFTSYFIIPLGAILFIESYVVNHVALDSAVTTTSAALLGLLPKGLVLLTSVSLALGVIKLARRKTLVQELFGIESLARADVLCMDKTGTLTTGEMEAMQVITLSSSAVNENAAALLCASFESGNNVLDALKRRFPCANNEVAINTVHFSSENAWSGAEFSSCGTLIMGAPEKILKNVPQSILNAQSNGAHVIVFAHSDEHIRDKFDFAVTPLFAVCLMDKIRDDVQDTLRYFEKQGVKLMIFSGDSVNTTVAVAKRAGLSGNAIEGGVLHNDADYTEAIEKCCLFGRVLPDQKTKLIKSLQSKGHTVAMLGDGVNDVLAIRQADCGIAMASGCDASRRVARLVLMDNNFASLPHVVSEGRRVINNISCVASFFLTKTCFSFMLSLICALTGTAYPFEPLEVSIYSILFEALPALILTVRPNDARISGDIVVSAIKRALPYALSVTAGTMFFTYVLPDVTFLPFAWLCLTGASLIIRTIIQQKRAIFASKSN